MKGKCRRAPKCVNHSAPQLQIAGVGQTHEMKGTPRECCAESWDCVLSESRSRRFWLSAACLFHLIHRSTRWNRASLPDWLTPI